MPMLFLARWLTGREESEMTGTHPDTASLVRPHNAESMMDVAEETSRAVVGVDFAA